MLLRRSKLFDGGNKKLSAQSLRDDGKYFSFRALKEEAKREAERKAQVNSKDILCFHQT